MKEKISDILNDNHYAPIADSVDNNEFSSLSDLAKIDADNILDDEEKKENKYNIIKDFADADSTGLID